MMNEPRAARPMRQETLPASRPETAPWRDSLAFLRGFVRHPAQVGSIIPSSHRLEQRLVRSAGLAQAYTVVELGPGTGGTSAAFLRVMPAQAQLLAIELDGDFHQHLCRAIRDPRFLLALGSAEQLADFLAERRLPAPDAIISGIPFSTMPAEVAQKIAAAVAGALRPGGRFVAYQVRAHVASFVSPHLGLPDKCWEVVNVPPVRVFSWVKPQPAGSSAAPP
jgi:phosphatidylethanolamine/phosphatidyl-N-methylethanolamine N-methyltransferase